MKINNQEQKNNFKNRNKIRIAFLIIALLCIAELVYSNTHIDIENFIFKSNDVPAGFDGAKIVHISDYHNHGGSYDERLLKNISVQNPDYIFLTGDIADSICTDIDKANTFLENVSEIATCYLVWGNHDYSIDDKSFEKMKNCAEKNNITVLENEFIYIERNGDKMMLTGTVNTSYEDMLEDYPDDETFSVWLHHYPEDFKEISDLSEKSGSEVDLLFTGHAHGGLIRMPFIKGIYAPGQGFIPEYTSGMYEYNGSDMIVSRGVGNSGYTRRFFNSFHLVVCTLESED